MGNVVFEEARELAARGHEVHVATITYPGIPEFHGEEDGIIVHRFPAQVRWTRTGLSVGVEAMMHDPSFDAVHLHAPFFGVQELAVFRMWFGWRPQNLIITYHMDVVAGGLIGVVTALYRRLFLKTLLTKARSIVVASMDYATGSWLSSFWQVVEPKVMEIPFGVDTARFYPEENPARSQVQLMFLGGLDKNHYFKGLGVLINALEQLQDRSDWKLLVVGDGDLRAGYEQQVKDAGIAGRITFLGHAIGEAERLYRESDVFVFPSTDRSEAFGLVALEAQASGTPVVASDLAGVRTVVVDYKTGLLVPPMNVSALATAIAWMIDHSEVRASMGKAARERVESFFTWEKHVSDLVKVYEQQTHKR